MNGKINQEFLQHFPPWMNPTLRFALVKLGGGIVAMSGSIAGNTFARNRSGNYVRARTKPVNPRSDIQVKARSVVAFLSEYWYETLDADQRAAWNLYAASVAMKNKLGETIYLSGFNQFMRSNCMRKFQLMALVDDGPTDFTLPPKDAILTIDADASPQCLTFTLDLTMDWLDETIGFMHIRQGIPQNKTRNFFAGPWHNLGVIQGSSTPWTTPVPFTPHYPLAEGQKCWCIFRIYRIDGRVSEPWTVSATVHSQAIGEVPALLGLTQEQAVALLTSPKVQLILGTVTTEHSGTVPVDHIISCDPVIHTRLSAGDPVNIVVSLGPEGEGGGEAPPE